MKIINLFLVSFLFWTSAFSQIGGDNTYEFLNLTSSSRVLALGNALVNTLDDDINLAHQLPSLNHSGLNNQISANFTNYYAGINFGSLLYGLPSKKFENITLGLQYYNYGEFNRTDEYANSIGSFNAGEYAVYASTAVHLDSSLLIGAALKGVYSNFDSYISYGLLTDVSATYSLKDGRMMASLLMRNLGFQIKTYAGAREPMPFELLFGVSTKLEHAPLRWSITWAHLENWDLSYEDLESNNLNGESVVSSYSFRDNLVSHLHLGMEFLFSTNFNLRFGYNFKRRQELALELFKHNVGMSWGFTMKVLKFHFNYSRASLHATGPMHTFSITTNLAEFSRK
jgi:hypothetical protein